MRQEKPYSKGFAKPVLITALAVAVVLVASAIAFYLVLVRAPAEIAGNVAEEFREFFNFTPRVTIDQTVVIEQSTPIMEASTLSRNLFVRGQVGGSMDGKHKGGRDPGQLYRESWV